MKKVREGYKMSELGEIPIEWQIKSINDICYVNPDTLSNKSDDSLSLEYIDIESVTTRRINEIKKLEFKDAPSRARRLIKRNDVIMSTVRPYLKAFAKINIEKDNLVCSTGFAVLRAKKNINHEFLFQSILSDYYIQQLSNKMVGSNYPAVNSSDVRESNIILPPLEEQEKIASILSTVDEQIDNVDALIEKNKELKKGLMQTLLTKGIGHTKFKKTEIGEIPEEWDVIKFFDFVDKIIDFRGRTPKKLGMDWGNGDIQALSANNVKMGKIDFSLECYLASEELYEKWMSGNELKNGDIIMTMEAPLGNVALVPDERKYILSQRVIALKTKDFINNKFMKYMLMSDGVQRQLETLSTGTTAKGINQKNLARVYVKIPMIKEQEKIASILFKIDEKIEEYQNKKQKLEEIKKGLMQQLLTGKIRVL